MQLPIGPLARQQLCRAPHSRGPAATTPGLHPGNDGSSPSGSTFDSGASRASVCQPAEQPGLNPGDCGFESRLRHLVAVMAHGAVRKQAKRRSSNLRALWVRVPLAPSRSQQTVRLCGAARSARHPVTVEVRGSNPLRDAGATGAGGTHAAQASASDWLRPRSSHFASAGHWRALGAVTPAPQAVQVQLLLDALDRFSFTTARSSSGTGCWPLKPATRVRIPHGSLVAASSGRDDASMPSGSSGCAGLHRPGALDGSSITTARSSRGSGPWPFKPAARVQIPHGSLVRFEQHSGSPAKDTHAIPGRGPHESPAHGQVVQLADTRRSERRALAGLGVRLSPWPH